MTERETEALEAPTPESLREMAEWFDNPNESPDLAMVHTCCGGRLTPGMALRLIAETMERAQARTTEETP